MKIGCYENKATGNRRVSLSLSHEEIKSFDLLKEAEANGVRLSMLVVSEGGSPKLRISTGRAAEGRYPASRSKTASRVTYTTRYGLIPSKAFSAVDVPAQEITVKDDVIFVTLPPEDQRKAVASRALRDTGITLTEARNSARTLNKFLRDNDNIQVRLADNGQVELIRIVHEVIK